MTGSPSLMCNLHFFNFRDFDNVKAGLGVREQKDIACAKSNVCPSFFFVPLVSSWFCDLDSQVNALYSEGKTIVFHPIDSIKHLI